MMISDEYEDIGRCAECGEDLNKYERGTCVFCEGQNDLNDRCGPLNEEPWMGLDDLDDLDGFANPLQKRIDEVAIYITGGTIPYDELTYQALATLTEEMRRAKHFPKFTPKEADFLTEYREN